MDHLASHIYHKYGEQWDRFVRLRNLETGRPATHGGKKPLVAPDLYGIFPTIEKKLFYNKKTYTIFDSPHDGSCMYHSLSAVLQPLHLDNTPSADSLKRALIAYYSQRGQVRKMIEKALPISFEERLKDLQQPYHWGEYTDAFILATIFGVKFNIIIVSSIASPTIKSVQEVKGFRKDGKKVAIATQLHRMLIYFENEQHYGVAVTNE